MSAAARAARWLFAAAFLRSASVGLSGVLLGIYLAAIGATPAWIGLVVAAGLSGTSLATLWVSLRADRAGRRRVLVSLAVAAGAGLAVFALLPARLPLLALAAALGMVNGLGRDRGPLYSLDHAILPHQIPPEQRTRRLAWYHITLDAGNALGSLAAAAPAWMQGRLGLEAAASQRLALAAAGALGLGAAICYARLPAQVEISEVRRRARPSPRARRLVGLLASITALDAFGGGFLGSALLAYWFFERFGAREQALGLLFFAARLANAVSYLLAARLARRIGLIRTMVFTHLPASLLLMVVPRMPDLGSAAALFLVREILVEMDVPTRQSFTVAVVAEEERTFAAGITSLSRNLAYTISPGLAGWTMQALALSAPLYLGAGLKVVHDLALFAAFRNVRPPEEERSA